ncbi:MFS transporter [Arthrobacter sp. NPDC090010]|uniref:MFS transporter n=1 Tax=Arthrobacter sp. NPDC090010 TaxID=3363942 RepID=UPI00381EC30D
MSSVARRALLADLVSTAVFPLAITGSTAVVPIVGAELHAPAGLAVWVVLAYNTVFAATLLGAGRFADRTNRARFFLAGNLLVAVTGIASALATTTESLIALRAIAGLGAAMCAAGGSSMILAAFQPAHRPRVYRYSGVVLGASLAVGPLLSQVLVGTLGWRAVFAVPAVLALVAAAASIRLPDWPHDTERVDSAGVLTFAGLVAAGCVILGLIGTAPPATLIMSAAATALVGVSFVRKEVRADSPALPLDLLVIPEFRWYATASGAFMGCLVSALALLPLLAVGQTSPALITTCLVLVTAAPAILPLLIASLTRRAPRKVVSFCLLVCGVASVLTAFAAVPSPFSQVAVILAALCLGVSLGASQGIPDGQGLAKVPATRGGAGAGLFSTTRMTIETLVLAATTGLAAAVGVGAGALVSGVICALVLLSTPLTSRGDASSHGDVEGSS